MKVHEYQPVTDGMFERPVKMLVEAPFGYEGEGFPVRRAFAGIPRDLLDPFVHMDQMGEIDYPPYEPRGTDWHPHRGFETVTYMMAGEFQHQDSHGGGGLIRPGDTQWMTAGSGILHIETPPEHLVVSGGLFHGVQLWVNLPSAKKWLPPAYQHIGGGNVQILGDSNGDSVIRLIAGSIGDHSGPGSTHTPILMAHVTVYANGKAVLPVPSNYNTVLYVLEGDAVLSSAKIVAPMGTTAVMGSGGYIELRSGRSDVDVLVLAGEPIREPVVQYGPFVMNTKAEIQQCFMDYQQGKLGVIPENGIQPYRPK